MRITISSSINVSGTNLSGSASPASISVTPASAIFVEGDQSILTSATTLNKGAVVTPGWLFATNSDATNTISISVDSAVATPFATLTPGSFCVVPVPTATLYAKATPSAADLSYILTSA